MESVAGSFTMLLENAMANPQGGLLFICMVALIGAIIFLSRRITLLTKGGDGKSLEGTMRRLQERVAELETESKRQADAVSHIGARVKRSVQGVSVQRFDPFQNAGGQQSFSTAFLNESGDGAIISGIHARDGVRVYSKSVTAFSSERELSEEEMAAIADAKARMRAN